MATVQRTPHINIRLPCSTDVGLCSFYRYGGCGNQLGEKGCERMDRCPYLHICPSYLAGCCIFRKKCKLNHKLLDDHNKVVLRVKFKQIDSIRCEENAREIVSKIFPKVCRNYNYAGEGCDRGDGCRYLHLCGKMVNRMCKRSGNCQLNHDHTDPHDKAILRKYQINLHRDRNWKLLHANLLFPGRRLKKDQRPCECPRGASTRAPARTSNVRKWFSTMTLRDEDRDEDSDDSATSLMSVPELSFRKTIAAQRH
ncbi:uncharacterized protein LOC141908647 isoform X2 [Tubulanus polymorphus]